MFFTETPLLSSVAANAVALAVVLGLYLGMWPPHEDETLALLLPAVNASAQFNRSHGAFARA